MIWEYIRIKMLEENLEIFFVEYIFNAIIKSSLVGFFCILGIQHIISSASPFSICFRKGLNLGGLFLVFSFEFFVNFFKKVILTKYGFIVRFARL